jgi:hypothetical protein
VCGFVAPTPAWPAGLVFLFFPGFFFFFFFGGCGRHDYQLIREVRPRVMKYTWLAPPERTEAKNTWGTEREEGQGLKPLGR